MLENRKEPKKMSRLVVDFDVANYDDMAAVRRSPDFPRSQAKKAIVF
jgi:hypothetical protein